ncbi:hypothetical protein C0431_13015 [bacterium]|nr:hypothetical protein [bacterium]
MPTAVSNPSVVLNDHKDVLIYQFRLLETLPANERSVVLGYLSMMWQLTTVATQPLDTFNISFRYIMESAVTRERYGFLVQMDPIQGIMHSFDFEGLVSADAA